MMRSRCLTAVVVCVAMLGCALVARAQSPQGETLLLVVDASGSMWGQVDGENKIVIARRVLAELVDGLADGTEVGVIAYGHRREGDCDDIETVIAIGPFDRDRHETDRRGPQPEGQDPDHEVPATGL